jgi:hypothetical protein
MGLRKNTTVVAEELLEQLRGVYRDLGPGFPTAATHLFSAEGAADGGDWALSVNGHPPRLLNAHELASTDLFVLPSTWEVMRAEVRSFKAKRDVVTVTGFIYCRPRGSWEHLRLPLLHVWTICLDRALRFESLLDGLELRRADGLTRCAA